MKRILTTLAALLMAATTLLASGPFREHRWESFHGLMPDTASIVFTGNSITNMHDWWEAYGNHAILNRGTSGGFSYELLPQLESIVMGHPDKVFVGIGTNDLCTVESIEATADNIALIVTRLRRESPRTKVYVQSVIPSTNSNGFGRGERIPKLNELLKEKVVTLNEELGDVYYLDVFSKLVGADGISFKTMASGLSLAYDNLHPTVLGYGLWCNTIKNEVGSKCIYNINATTLHNGGQNNSTGDRITCFAQQPVAADDILFIGDEMVSSGEWHEWLRSAHVKNRGLGWGYTGSQLTQEITNAPLYFKHKSSKAPRAIVIYAGVQEAHNSLSAADFHDRYQRLITALRAKATTSTIYLLTPLQTPTASVNTFINSYRAELNALAAENENVKVVDATAMNGVTKYFYVGDGGNYLTSYGYAKVAQYVEQAVKADYPDCDLHAVSDAEVAERNALYAARTTLGDAVTAALRTASQVGDGVGEYPAAALGELNAKLDEAFAVLRKDTPTAQECAAAAAALSAVVPAMNQPVYSTDDSEAWYTLCTPNRNNYYAASNGTQLFANQAVARYAKAQWKFVQRADGTLDIVNRADGKYVSPQCSYSSQLSMTASQPAAGWTLDASAAAGLYVVHSGTVQLNVAPSKPCSEGVQILNWSSNADGNDLADAGCQYALALVTEEPELDPSDIPDGETVTVTVDRTHGTFTSGKGDASWNSAWTSNDGLLRFSASANNMQWNGDNIDARCGTAGSSTYTLQPVDAEHYIITAYSLRMHSIGNGTQQWTIDGQTVTSASASDVKEVSVSGLKVHNVQLVETGGNDIGTLLYDFTVTLQSIPEGADNDYEERKVVFDNASSSVPYRIPAVAQNRHGDLIFVADYRYSKADIGMATNGKLDLRYRIRYADGTWSDVMTLAPCITSPTFTAFGDPCIVADRESDRVMVTSCCGNVSFPGGTHANHQGWSRWYSDNGGRTWESTYTDLSNQVMEQVDQRTNDRLAAFFIGSGKISQSSTIKVGDYYRLYCASNTRMEGGKMNFVWYSDDFGETWHMLGHPDEAPINGGDEPKADELPDGSVVISSRDSGRIFNIFHYTDVAKGEGSWGSQVTSSTGNNGTFGASCNGEILVMPVTRASDGAKTYLMLQSVPMSGSRVNVGIYYKELTDLTKYRTAKELAPNWTGYQISQTTSAYSTMCQMQDGDIAFFYEENEYNGGYDMVYKRYDIATITGGKYHYSPLTDQELGDYLSDGVSPYVSSLTIADDGLRTTIETLAGDYAANPDYDTYAPLNAVLSNLPSANATVCPYASPEPADGAFAADSKVYKMRIKGTIYITATSMTDGSFNTSSTTAPTTADGYWIIAGDVATGYRFYNVAAGPTKVLGVVGSEGAARTSLYDVDAVPAGVKTYFDYKASQYRSGGSTFFIHGTDNNALNVRAPFLALWNSGSCFNDDGSCILLTSVKYDLTSVRPATVRPFPFVYTLDGRRAAADTLPARTLFIEGGKKHITKP